MQLAIKPEFQRWAEGFAGCDGGNLDGDIWFCGIEYGGDPAEGDLEFADESAPNALSDEGLRRILKFQYNIKLAKLVCALLGDNVSDYHSVALREKLFAGDSNYFRLNLYPISFATIGDDSWPKWLYEATGLPTKSLYRSWCQLHRFEKMADRVQKFSPKLIIGTGKSFDSDFSLAFGGVNALFSEEFRSQRCLDRDLKWKPINDGRTVLVITPFLGGRYGLNSDVLIEHFGRAIVSICRDALGQDWLG